MQIISPNILIFFVAVFLAFFIPGDFLIRNLKLSTLPRFVIALAVGMSLWAYQGLIFGYLSIRWASYLYLLFLACAWFRLNFKQLKINFSIFKHLSYPMLLTILTGTILNMSAVAFMGVKTQNGLFFCCRGVPDAIYQLSLTNQLIKNFPPFEPGAQGVYVRNYHYLSNLVVADIARVFQIPLIQLQFRYMSLLLAVLLGLSAFSLAKVANFPKSLAYFLALFIYTSGDILYLLLLKTRGYIDFSVTILDDATKLLAGPPRAFSIVLFFAGLSLFVYWIKKKDITSGILTAFIFASLIGFKVYTGIFALIGFFALGIYYITQKNLKLATIPLLTALISFAIYLPVNRQAGGIYPIGFWRFENFAANKDLGLIGLELKRLVFLNDHKHLQVIFFELLFIILYFVFLFGTVLIGFFQTRRSLSTLPRLLNIFLISGLVATILVGSFFVQKTGGTNSIQFIIGGFIIGAIYASLAIYYWQKKLPSKIKIILITIIIILTSARGLHEAKDNLKMIIDGNHFIVPKEEIAALDYLKSQTPKDSKIMLNVWMSEEEPFLYASFLADRPIFLAGAGVLRDHGLDTKGRDKTVDTIMNSNNPQAVHGLLAQADINYLYVVNHTPLKIPVQQSFLKTVFQNQKVTILKVVSKLSN